MNDSEVWFEKAEDDMEAAVIMKDGGKYSQAAFLFQQASEKALKAVLVERSEGVPKSHDCFILAKKARTPENIKESADTLSPYYFRTRYPDAGLVALEESEIQKIKSSAEEVIEWCREEI